MKFEADLHRALMNAEEHNSRLERVLLKGRVAEVKGDKLRLTLGEPDPSNGKEFLSPWVRWQGSAGSELGGFSMSIRPAVGQPMMLMSPSGDIGPASLAVFDSFTDDQPNPDAGADMSLKRGDTSIQMDAGGIRLMVGGVGIEITGDEVKTIGRTRLNNGSKPVHRIDDKDDADNKAVEGASDVYA